MSYIIFSFIWMIVAMIGLYMIVSPFPQTWEDLKSGRVIVGFLLMILGVVTFVAPMLSVIF